MTGLSIVRNDPGLSWWRWRYAIPPEKGGWIWWLGPLLVGIVAADKLTPALLAVLVGAFAAFCIRQPIVLLIKVLRRGRAASVAPSLVWIGIYAFMLIASVGFLLGEGRYRIVALGLLAAPVLVWHAILVWRAQDRHNLAADLIAALSLSLTGPAAYWAAGGIAPAAALCVWALPAAQTAASIVHMVLRLRLRALSTMPPLRTRLSQAIGPLLAHGVAFAMAVATYSYGHASAWVMAALAIPLAEGTVALMRPQLRVTPMQLGLRQLLVSTTAMTLLAAGMKG